MNQEMNKLLEYAETGVLYLDIEYTIREFTDIVMELTTITKKDIGKKICEINEFSNETFFNDLCRVSNEMVKVEREIEYIEGKTCLFKLSPCVTDDKKFDGIVIICFDITNTKTIEHRLAIEREKYRTIAELSDCGLWEYNPSTKALNQSRKLNGRYFNEGMIVENYRQHILDRNVIYPEDISIFNQYCDSMDNGDDYYEYEFRVMGDSDEFMWLRFQGSAVKDKNGNVLSSVGKTLNIDEEKRDRISLLEKTQLDSLTQIYNSGTTKDKITKCFKRSSESEKHALFFIDIDDFKEVNDKWGHLYGDVVLEGFSGELRRIATSTDVVGRFGGDEFLLLVKGIAEYGEVIHIAEAIKNISKNGFPGLRNQNHFSVSIGISIYGVDGNTYDELFQKADIALYAAKDAGKNSYEVYNEHLSYGGTRGETTRKNPAIVSKNKNSVISSPYTNKRLVDYAVDVSSENQKVEEVLENIFLEIGKYYDLGRIFVMQKDVKSNKYSLTYEWNNDGLSKEGKQYEQIITLECFNHEKRFEKNGYFKYNEHILEKISETNQFDQDTELFNEMGIKAFICCSLYDGRESIGFVGYARYNNSNSWKREEEDTLISVTKIIEGSVLRSRSETQLNKEEFYMQAMLNNQNMINYAIEPNSYKVVYFSKYTNEKCPSLKLGDICYNSIMERDTPCETCPINGLNSTNNKYSVESYDDRLNAWYSTTASAVMEENGETLYLICRSDVTSFLERVNGIDTLTGILSLPKFEAEAMKLLAQNCDKKYAVLCIDINKFKYINDEYGFEVGDEVLRIFAGLVDSELVSGELFCRASGDNFIVFKEYKNQEDLVADVFHVFRKVFSLYKKIFSNLNIVIVAGVYMLEQKDRILSLAIDKANLAKKTIKGYHKSDIAIYDDKLHKKITKEKEIEQQMVGALANKEFVVYLQPKVDLITKEIVGAEALVRWKQFPDIMVPPSEFIPTFEKNGFISELDFYVYEETFRKIKKWNNQGKPPIIISVNVSRIHLGDSRFMEKMDALVEKYEIQPEYIEMELTESIIFGNWKRFIVFTNQLRDRGFLISIDDFGSGFSSLNLLTKLPVDIIKIDKEFFLENTMLQRNKAVICSIIQLAKGLGLRVISEGVETKEQEDFLIENGCEMAQGFLFYKPLPMEEFSDLFFKSKKKGR